ncbi:PREDICTED: CD209 antigen-like protein A isoform X2 [Poecilia mexicana]|uniref:CD209 antigen-like protein A isoform X2 n=1 Tax=Poecilia mexicana TaxID=48701 RepID=UPI00072E05E8|nr:PREDICTED: CD209 antigen-like protein A isoform X2 [Poecilia mexicana]
MFSDIKSTPDLIQRVRYSRAKQEEAAEWVEEKVHIYNYINYMMDDSQLGGGKQIENQPAADKVSTRFTTLSRMVLYISVLAGIISLTVYFTLEIIKLKNSHSNLSDIGDNYKLELQAKLLEMAANYSQLQNSYEILSKNHSQLIDQVNRLNNTITRKWCPDGWTRFGSSCYFKGEETKTWYDSRTYCQDRRSDLVIINSKAEQEFIKQFNKNGESWIGLQGEWISVQRTYDWKWVDGSPLTQSFWGTGRPNNYQYQLNAICCDYEGKWKQAYNYNNYNYNYKNWICEK